jgi:hypothetical protein
MKLKITSFTIAIIILIIFIIFTFLNKQTSCNCSKKEGMLGHIRRSIRPIAGPLERKIRTSFSNPTLEYYNNKLYQIFR